MNMNNQLLQNIAKLHTTQLGTERIRKNLSLEAVDILEWCREKFFSDQAAITRRGKNYYIDVDNCIITVNAYSYTIITAHPKKRI